MTAEYITAILGLIGSIGAVVGLVWAVRHRQLRVGDEVMYETITDDEPDYAGSGQTPAPVSARARWLFVAVLATVFLSISWLIVQTVRIGTRTAPTPPLAQRLPSSD